MTEPLVCAVLDWTLDARLVGHVQERVGLRLQLRKAQAEAGDIVLLYGDESEALTHPNLARAWAKRGAGASQKNVAMMGSLDHVERRLIVQLSSDAHAAPTATPQRWRRAA